MQNERFRFSHDKRFRNVSFEEFLAAAQAMRQIALQGKPNAQVVVLTAEDGRTYNYTTVTIVLDEVCEALKNRRCYQLDELSKEVWDRSFRIELCVKDDSDPKPFMICLGCDRYADPKRLMFYGQCVPSQIFSRVTEVFGRRAWWYRIGDGFSKLSEFNALFVRTAVRF